MKEAGEVLREVLEEK
jgi:hypothetical protein